MFRFFLQFLPFAALLTLVSCSGAKKAIYFNQDLRPDSITTALSVLQHNEAVIQPDDILAINIASISFYKEGGTSQVFLDGGLSFTSTPNNASGGTGTTTGKNSYLVDSSGYIDYPRLGKIKVGGLSTREAKDLLAIKLKDYLIQPAIEVRIVNYRITMLGEIGVQGPIYASNHKMTIIDAIAAAGGVPISGRKDNILVIRDAGDKREFGHVDLNSRNVFNSPYFYLKQNDIVYVEPSRIRRQEANEFLRFYLPTITGLVSTAVSFYALVLISQQQ